MSHRLMLSVLRILRRLERFGIKLKRPANIERLEGMLFSYEVPLQAAGRFSRDLRLSDEFVNMVHGISHSDPRAYYFYGVSDEIIKASTAVMRWIEMFSEPDIKPSGTDQERRIFRLVDSAIEDEQNLWIRKLTEHLIDTISFSQCNEQPYYRAYIAATALDDHLSLAHDFKEFFSCSNQNLEESAKQFAEIIQKVQVDKKITSLPFLREAITPDKLPRPGNVFKSIRNRYKDAIKLASEDEKLVLGLSYGDGFAAPSKSVHGRLSSAGLKRSEFNRERGLGYVGLLSINILARAHDLCGIKPAGVNLQLRNILGKSTIAPEIVKRQSPDFRVGDIVVAYSDLAEIMAENTSQYGYKSFKVRYLGQSPLPNIKEDEFPARYLSLLFKKSQARSFLESNIKSLPNAGEIDDLFKRKSDEEIFSAFKACLIDLDKSGVLIPMITGGKKSGKKPSGYQKK